ncbi:intein-containing Rv2578c family radical SAM protein [Microbacterium sp. STN6]|uniref:intein-containing Rv2578c family radical SAM protein n=1 Tax=Microbacterium sp. STN6 TaxID=2995588 RepID=UPI002260F56C|nr:intein-containing Rv2578c family radical SAM protein [Microbacterium sp. STN6]MCX7520909.1 intein-containing Rv2578c family radical SAM protein [Microbacterium sp. STN6]
MRWSGQELGDEQQNALPGLARLNNLVRSVCTPEFAGITFHEVLARSALNKVPGTSTALPFGWTINPYRGCSHACSYCLDPETLILMGDGRQKPLRALHVGDEIYGTERRGNYRRYVKTLVLAKWGTHKRAIRTTLADGTELTSSADHRFLTERGWKFVKGAMAGAGQRPYLTVNNKLMGFGHGGPPRDREAVFTSATYRLGYLTGMIRGDGMLFTKKYPQRAGGGSHITAFRLALADAEALDRTRRYLELEGVATVTRPFAVAAGRRPMHAIHTSRGADFRRITSLIEWPSAPTEEWHAGYLAGIFDAEGSCSQGVLRISNRSPDILAQICSSLNYLGIRHVLEAPRENGVTAIRVRGGLAIRSRFFELTRPWISRKLSIEGRAVKSDAALQIISIVDLDTSMHMIDITTGTGDFIANGTISHNCFARATHKYLDLDAGKDFDNEIIVKVNVAEVLAKELAKPTWQRQPVALGTNTDPYQRAEGRYSLMPGIIDALAASGTPFSILTKGTLLRRDLDKIADAAANVPVDLAMSIAIYDDELQHAVEPGTPSTSARLATVSAIRERGLDCTVFLMPILPYLTDTREHLDDALARAKAAGATSVLYSALHLRPGAREWYLQWLQRAHPELMGRYARMYGNGAYAPKEYREWLAARIRPLIAKHGLRRGREDPLTGGVRSTALARPRFAAPSRPEAPTAAARAASDALGAPTLF